MKKRKREKGNYMISCSVLLFGLLSCKDPKKLEESDILPKEENVDMYSYTALGNAVKQGDLEIVKKLITEGADIDNGKSDEYYVYDVLCVAIDEGKYDIAKYLLSIGSNPNRIYNENGLNPLVLSIMNKNIEMVKLLLEYKADINGSGDLGGEYEFVPLKIAIDYEDRSIVQLLLESGADTSILDSYYKSELQKYTYESKGGVESEF
ncbi:MAG: ankyrin repeat domain-containing protein [Myroides sp.]|jgi:ankyrin repeat protein|nr:ankyrin repeat domain-containing protein [Myroides sp.]